MRIVFNYYKTIQTINAPFSFIFGFLLGINAFLICFCTFGLFLSVFYFELFYKQQYYFYFNKGFSRHQLIGFSFLGNGILTALFITAKNIFHL
jgi:hypothetical protein